MKVASSVAAKVTVYRIVVDAGAGGRGHINAVGNEDFLNTGVVAVFKNNVVTGDGAFENGRKFLLVKVYRDGLVLPNSAYLCRSCHLPFSRSRFKTLKSFFNK